jgi:hypothetical protein
MPWFLNPEKTAERRKKGDRQLFRCPSSFRKSSLSPFFLPGFSIRNVNNKDLTPNYFVGV